MMKLRLSKDLTYADISRSLGICKTSAGHWESEESLPNDENMKKLADLLGTTPAYLKGEIDEVGKPVDKWK